MKPEIARVLEVCAVGLMGDVAPHVSPSYRQATVLSTAVILTSVREELDRIAERRILENRALRSLFAGSLKAVEETGLRERLAAAAREEEPGFKISELEASNARLRSLLIDLHIHVESLDSEAAQRVEAQIWQELKTSTERRKLSLDSF
jgi:hypothetical protein